MASALGALSLPSVSYSFDSTGKSMVPITAGAGTKPIGKLEISSPMQDMKDVFNNIGGFDKKMWMYIEDWDISRKFWDRGSILYLPTLIVKHDYSSSGLKSLRLSISF